MLTLFDDMADLRWDYQLKEWQRANPVVFSSEVNLDGVPYPMEIDLLKVFKADGFRLQTWGRSKGVDGKFVLERDPHWIAVRKGTPLHHDPSYPRYSHHLKIRVDPGIFVRGMDQQEFELKRGVFYVLDTHSPHQIFHKDRRAIWNVAVSVDCSEILKADDVIPIALRYAKGGVG